MVFHHQLASRPRDKSSIESRSTTFRHAYITASLLALCACTTSCETRSVLGLAYPAVSLPEKAEESSAPHDDQRFVRAGDTEVRRVTIACGQQVAALICTHASDGKCDRSFLEFSLRSGKKRVPGDAYAPQRFGSMRLFAESLRLRTYKKDFQDGVDLIQWRC